MTLRIVVESLDPGTMLRVAGALSGAEVAELDACCRKAKLPVTLELEGVVSADEPGLVLLLSVAAAGATLVGTSPYLSMRLGRPFGDAH